MSRAMRLSLVLLGMLALALVGGAICFAIKPLPNAITPTAASTVVIIDEWMETVEARQYDKTGHLTQVMTVSQWQHQQGAPTAEWQNPQLSLMGDKGTWSLSAQHGTSTQQTLWGQIDEMHLSNHVEVRHTTPDKADDWRLNTEYLLLLPEQRIAQTTNTVFVEGPWMHMQSQGLTADLNQNAIEFVNTVNSRYTLPEKSSHAKL